MKKVILIVEDEKQIREDIELILSIKNYDVISAENGEAAVNILKTVVPDLIISDIMMPVMDGFELLKKLQSSPDTSSIPFLFLTAKIDRQDIREGMNLGADDFITKPFKFDDLTDAIESRLKKKELADKRIEETFEDLKVTIRYSLPHEIRNPINVILGFTDLLKNNLDSTSREETLDMLSHIYSAGARLNNMFENYLLISNLEMLSKNNAELNKKLLDKTPSIEILLIDITKQISEKYERSGDIQIQLEDSAVFMDNDYFKKICEEIIDNAFKFSKPGQIVHVHSKIDNRFLVLEITDNGRGIKRENLNRIAEYIQFERRLYEQQGIGLGLALSKKIVEIHRGIFKIESEVDKFTKIIIKLPRINS